MTWPLLLPAGFTPFLRLSRVFKCRRFSIQIFVHCVSRSPLAPEIMPMHSAFWLLGGLCVLVLKH